MKKYPRTFHLSCSPEIHGDDKLCDMGYVERLIDDQTEVVLTEKLDGGNCAMKSEGVFARSHAGETRCSSFDYIKNVHYYPNLHDISCSNLVVFGENMYAIHSVKYTNLKDYFYAFNILDRNALEFFSYDALVEWANSHNILTAPAVYEGPLKSLKWLESFLAAELKKPSFLGGEREGFVLRVRGSFPQDDFEKNVFKYVRRGHVQPDSEHWSKNWVKAELSKDRQ